jgi:hypothetical protein
MNFVRTEHWVVWALRFLAESIPRSHDRSMSTPFSWLLQEPYLIAKLDSAEKAWKEMSVWFFVQLLAF